MLFTNSCKPTRKQCRVGRNKTGHFVHCEAMTREARLSQQTVNALGCGALRGQQTTKLTNSLTATWRGMRHTAASLMQRCDRMTQFWEDLKRAPLALLAATLLAGCATTPMTDTSKTPTITGEPAATITPAAVPPPVPVNPMLVASTDYPGQREKRLLALAATPHALPAGEEGYYLDVLYAQLRQVLGAHAEVERSEGTIRVVLPPTVTFEVASATLSADAKTVLSSILGPLRDYQSLMISVHGHTDSSGPPEVNQRLSAQRALTVAEQLRALSFPANQLMAIGHGASQPSADNTTAEGRQINRRVELMLEAIGSAQ